MNKQKYVLITFLLLTVILFPINIFALDRSLYLGEVDKQDAICNGHVTKDTCDADVNCKYDASGTYNLGVVERGKTISDQFAYKFKNKCVARACNEITTTSAGGGPAYCVKKSEFAGDSQYATKLYVEKRTCSEYDNCVKKDDWGAKCDLSKSTGKCPYGNGDKKSSYYQDSMTRENMCVNLYELWKAGATPNDKIIKQLKGYCDEIKNITADAKGYCYQAASSSYQSAYNHFCVGTGNVSCGENQISIYGGILGNQEYKCICRDGYVPNASNTRCYFAGGGSSKSNCGEKYNYAQEAFVQTCETDPNNSCEAAVCSVSVTHNGKKYDSGVEDIAINYDYFVNKKLDQTRYESYNGDNQPFRYSGTCELEGGGKATESEVICIDPAALYHSTANNNSYKCQGSLNPEGTTDKGFIKIYQLAIDKYQDEFAKETPLSDAQYESIHFAYRFWTFINDFGLWYSNSNHMRDIAMGFDGTAQNIDKSSGINYKSSYNNNIYNYFRLRLYTGNASKLVLGYENGINQSNYTGYIDAVNFYKQTLKTTDDIWINPLKFEFSPTGETTQDGKPIVEVTLNNIKQLNDSRFVDRNYVKNIECKDVYGKDGNCSIISDLPGGDYLHNNLDKVSFRVKINDITKPITVSVKYYDRRDAKNVIVATLGQNTNYQRLLFVNRNAKDFSYQETYKIKPNACSIIGTTLYDKDGNQTDIAGFTAQCCSTLENPNNFAKWCNIVGRDNYMCDSDWVKAGCAYACKPENSTGECTDTGSTQTIRISDFTPSKDTKIANNSDADICVNCAVNSKDLAGNSYLRDDVKSPIEPSKSYCQIYCVEEYEFDVPTHISGPDVTYGRFLTMRVEGRSNYRCFTNPSAPINKTQFDIDVENQKDAIIKKKKLLDEYDRQIKNLNDGISKVSTDSYTCSKAGTCDTSTCDNPDWAVDTTTCVCNHWNGPDIKYKNGKPDIHQMKITGGCTGTPTVYTYSFTYAGKEYKAESKCSCNIENNCSVGNDCSASKVIDELNNQRKKLYEEILGDIAVYNSIFTKYDSCFNIGNIGCNNSEEPYIEFSYDGGYYNDLKNAGKNYLKGTWNISKTDVKYYDSVNNNKYSCGYSSNSVPEQTTGNKYIEFSSSDGKTISIRENAKSAKMNKYSYVTIHRTATLLPMATWYVEAKNGNVTLDGSGPNKYVLGNVLPLSAKCLDNHNYNYDLTILGAGYNKDCSSGRLNTVISKMKDSEPRYYCDFKVAKGDCVGCETAYFFNVISLNDVFPNSGQLLKNSGNRTDSSNNKNGLSYERTPGPVWTTEKGKATQDLIEKSGTGIYNNSEESLQYSYTLTPGGMKEIRNYNKNTNYGDFNLDCNSNLNNIDYYGTCKSYFLNDIEEGKYHGVTQNKRNTLWKKYVENDPYSFWK